MKNYLPVKATFKRSNGWVLHQNLEKLQEHVYLIDPLPPLSTEEKYLVKDVPEEATITRRLFRLIRYKEVQQNKGLHHIAAVYEEVIP